MTTNTAWGSSRRAIDSVTKFDPDPRSSSRAIEVADVDEVAASNPPTRVMTPEPYRFNAGLVDAIRVAITLGRPLLLQGDPGSGKTRLAHAVAFNLGLPLERAYIKSATRSSDLLYSFDSVARLYDAQMPGARFWAPRKLSPAKYVRFGPFGRALVRATYGRRSVLLVDEIDKADLDFPNDLLHELDRLEMQVPEIGKTFQVPVDRPDLRPVIVVTNNAEKQLSSAFLRRCVYHRVEVPTSRHELTAILALHEVIDPVLTSSVLDRYDQLRGTDLTRVPGLAELIDWARYLQASGEGSDGAEQFSGVGALLKSEEDQRLISTSGWSQNGR